MEKFKALGLSDTTLEALSAKGFEEPTPIQAQTIPLLINGERDIVGQAQTGTGKTAAFGLPLIELLNDNSKKVQALILTPTRELAIQVAEEISSLKGSKKLFVLPVYGGQSYELQIRALKRGVQIVVGTPGRIRDHIEKRTLDLSAVTHVVLDEADEMLNMGFQEEVEEILKSVPQQHRMLLFSATMPAAILKLAKRYMKEYDLVEVKKEQLTTPLTEQIYFEVKDHERFEALCRIIDAQTDFYGIVFCRTKVETDNVARRLIDRGYDAEPIHGDITQAQREKVLRAFKAKRTRILVATDVAARGIDVNDLTHVVNFQLPQDPEAYVHRIGRTGRAGKEGTAITFISPKELRSLLFIQKIANTKIKKEKLPGIREVVEIKKEKMKNELRELLTEGNFESYFTLAQELMDEGADAQSLVAALLQYHFGNELKEENYQELQEFNSSIDTKGITRLFVAKGRMDKMNAKSIADFLSKESGVAAEHIKDVQVFDKFSFVNVPFLEAEQILVSFEKNKHNKRPLITRAKERTGGGGGGNKMKHNSKKEYEKKESNFKNRKEESPATTGGKKRKNKNLDYLEKPIPSSSKKKANSKENFDKIKFSFSDEDLSW